MSTLGIDFGDETAIGCYRAEGPDHKEKCVVVENAMIRQGIIDPTFSERYHPLYVGYDSQGRFVGAGVRAKMLAATQPKSTIYNIRSLLGRWFDDPEVQAARNILSYRRHYEICEDRGLAKVRIGSSPVAPEEAFAEVIAEILADALDQDPGVCIDDLVIAVPAGFNSDQKNKTLKAAALGIRKAQGLENGHRIQLDVDDPKPENSEGIRLVSRPAAAFRSYALEAGATAARVGGRAMVVEFGDQELHFTTGAVLAITASSPGEPEFEFRPMDTHRNPALGGNDVYNMVSGFVKDELARKGIATDNRLMWHIRDKVDKAVNDLSIRESTSIAFLDRDVSIPLTRAKLEHIIAPVLDQCRLELWSAMSRAELRKGDISTLVMVGEPACLQLIRKPVEEEIGTSARAVEEWDPVLCVARGAARSLISVERQSG